MGTFEKCVEDLKSLGLKKGDKVMVHSSFKSLGGIEGDINGFINALIEVVGDEGTLMLPTFTYDVVNGNNPVFDVRATKTQMGIIPEFFRKRPDVKRSVHPTHSIAVWGKDKEAYIKDHWRDNVTVGENSPLVRLKDNGGKILMVGCGIVHNTLIHGVEDYVRPPYAYSVDYTSPKYYRYYTSIDENDNITRCEFFHEFLAAGGYNQRYDKLYGLMEINEGYVLKAKSYLMDAKEVWDTVVDKMKEDPFYFVEQI